MTVQCPMEGTLGVQHLERGCDRIQSGHGKAGKAPLRLLPQILHTGSQGLWVSAGLPPTVTGVVLVD